MSRADWSFLEQLLEEGQEYSTGIGRVWLTVLFLFRMLVLGTAAESAWDDEQVHFVCNTNQPGCPAVCYDKAFPISHFRYFVLQVIFVSTPTIFYFGYVAIRSRGEKDGDDDGAEDGDGGSKGRRTEREKKTKAKDTAEEEDGGKGGRAVRNPPEALKLKGRLLFAYACSILTKVLLEVGFMVGLWFLYDGIVIAARFECTAPPCPHTVDCFVSRPTEKTIFTIYTQVIAAVSLLLNLIELLHLIQLAISHRLEKRYRAERPRYLPHRKRVSELREIPEIPAPGRLGDLPVEAAGCRRPAESYAEVAVNVIPGNGGSDSLPSYVNCVRPLGAARSPRAQRLKHHHRPDRENSGPALKSKHNNQKHYV